MDAGWIGPINSPLAFMKELVAEAPPVRLQKDVSRASSLVTSLIDRMTERFHAALKTGHASYQARLKSVLHEYRTIDVQQFARLRLLKRDRKFDVGVEYDELHDAEGPDGEKLYALCVVPVTSPCPERATATKKKRGPPTLFNWSSIEERARALLTSKGAPDRRNRMWTKEVFRNALIDWCEENGHGSPSPSTVDEHIDPVIQEFKRSLPRKNIR
jgi:hypothetical protein